MTNILKPYIEQYLMDHSKLPGSQKAIYLLIAIQFILERSSESLSSRNFQIFSWYLFPQTVSSKTYTIQKDNFIDTLKYKHLLANRCWNKHNNKAYDSTGSTQFSCQDPFLANQKWFLCCTSKTNDIPPSPLWCISSASCKPVQLLVRVFWESNYTTTKYLAPKLYALQLTQLHAC